MKQEFIPTTIKREIAKGIFFRPVKSWHSNTYAGERLEKIPGTGDGSGCMSFQGGIRMCMIPYTVTHRRYWNKKNPDKTISAFLSYPDAMGLSGGEYFWETYGTRKDGDIERFFGDDAEKKMEKKIIKVLSKNELPQRTKRRIKTKK